MTILREFDAGLKKLETHFHRSASQSIGIEGFISSYRTIQQTRIERKPGSSLKPFRSIKVALIDTGVVGVEDRRSLPAEFRPGQIKDGISFVHGKDGESETPWFVPSNEHGPQMAGIICSIDPYCELYTAKVADGRTIEAVESIVKVRYVNSSLGEVAIE